MSEVTSCRICGSSIEDVFDLGVQTLASRFPSEKEPEPLSAPLVLSKCTGECGLLQLKHTVSSSEMYTNAYGYRSGLNEIMKEHLKTIVDDFSKYLKLENGDTVVDIGSNDGTLLSYYPSTVKRIGIDPTCMQFKQYYDEDVTLIPTFFSKEVLGDTKVKCITSIAMFYDLPKPLEFMKDISHVLDPLGIWIMEQSYMPTMLEMNSYDTVCHEHLEYYCFKQIEWMCKKAGLRVLDVTLNESNGGSFRVTICHENAPYESNQENIQMIREKDNNVDLFSFIKNSEQHKKDLYNLIVKITNDGKKICIYGASTKGNTLLQYCGIDEKFITCAAERNQYKYGCRTPGTNIPIVSEDEVRKINPEYMLVLPWHFRVGIIKRENEYLQNGGKFIFPLPFIEIV